MLIYDYIVIVVIFLYFYIVIVIILFLYSLMASHVQKIPMLLLVTWPVTMSVCLMMVARPCAYVLLDLNWIKAAPHPVQILMSVQLAHTHVVIHVITHMEVTNATAPLDLESDQISGLARVFILLYFFLSYNYFKQKI